MASDQYVIVRYWRNRRVYLAGEQFGYTNESLRVETGTHTFDLGTPHNYSPPSRTVLVKDTTVLTPREIRFEPTEPPSSAPDAGNA